MTVLDKSVPYIRALMVMARHTIYKEIPLHEEYHYVAYDDSLKEAWCLLQCEVGLFDSVEQASQKWDAMLKEDDQSFKENFLFVADAKGHLVGSVGLWKGHDFKEDRLRVHYLAVSLKAQHKHIATSMMTKLCMKYDSIRGKYPLYLVTQSQSYGAIAFYSRLGFTPYLGETLTSSSKESEKNWEDITNILREKVQ